MKKKDVFRYEIKSNQKIKFKNDFVTTNHFRSKSLKIKNDISNDEMKLLYSSSIERYKLFKKKFANLHSVEDLKKFLRDKKYKGAWFRDGINDNGYTTSSYCYDFEKKKCFYSIGFPQSKKMNKSIDLKEFISKHG